MRISQSLIVASKDLLVVRRTRNIIYSVFVVPFVVSLLFPFVIQYIERKGTDAAALSYLLPSFNFFFMILAGMIPSAIASYSIVGEKVEKSIEPLLATPTTDGEILLGKGIAAVVPPLAAILAASVVFMGLTDAVTVGRMGYYYFPNWNSAIVFFLMVPLATVMSIEWGVLISSRVSDVRIAQQLGTLLVLPFAGIYVGGELQIVQLGDTWTLLVISGALALVDFALLYVVRAAFRREEILTKWK
ncbi:MAG: ABC transporter permease [Nitrososphaerota archaeon]|nr:ABC transporter permease [Nitrososphaerota archaeon]